MEIKYTKVGDYYIPNITTTPNDKNYNYKLHIWNFKKIISLSNKLKICKNIQVKISQIKKNKLNKILLKDKEASSLKNKEKMENRER